MFSGFLIAILFLQNTPKLKDSSMHVEDTRMKKLASALIATTFLAAACGSNAVDVVASAPDDSVEEVVTTDAPTSETPATDVSTTEAPAESTTTPGVDPGKTADTSEFCEISRRLSEDEPELNVYDDPETLQIYMTGLMEDVERMAEVAPPEIHADFTLVKDSLEAFEQLLIDADWDFLVASANMDELFEDDAELDAASDAMDEYDRDVCGIDDGAGTTAETIDD